MRTHLFIYIGLLLLLVSCISRPDYVLDEEKMVDVLTDVHRSEGLLELQQSNKEFSSNEEYKQAVMAAVLVKQGVTRAQYDSSLVWYGQHLQYLVKVYNKVQKNLTDEIEYWTAQDILGNSEFGVSEAGDSVQLWTVRDYYIFDEKKLSSFRFWEIKSDSNYVAGDSIIWHLHIPQIPESHFLVASLALNYQLPDTVFQQPISETVVIRKDTSVNLICVSDTARMFESIIASISLMKDSTNVPDRIAFVDSLSMIRMHR